MSSSCFSVRSLTSQNTVLLIAVTVGGGEKHLQLSQRLINYVMSLFIAYPDTMTMQGHMIYSKYFGSAIPFRETVGLKRCE